MIGRAAKVLKATLTSAYLPIVFMVSDVALVKYFEHVSPAVSAGKYIYYYKGFDKVFFADQVGFTTLRIFGVVELVAMAIWMGWIVVEQTSKP